MFACEDIGSGQPAENTDYWCEDGDPERGPHDFGVVKYEHEKPVLVGAQR
jgi:hypothetical protein